MFWRPYSPRYHETCNRKTIIVSRYGSDIIPFQEHANEPTSHNKMNKGNADTYAGSLAKQAAIAHTRKFLMKIE